MVRLASKLENAPENTGEMSSSEPTEDEINAKLAELENLSFGSDSWQEDGDDDPTEFAGSPSHTLSSVTSAALHGITVGIPTHILASKWAIAFILVAVTVLVGYFSHEYTENEEHREFEDRFLFCANEIIDQSQTNIATSFRVLSSFSKTITSLALFVNGSWPLFTVPHFETRASDLLWISKAVQVAVAPLVHDQDREGWEAYAVASQDWIQQSLDFEYMLSITDSPATSIGQAADPVQAQPIRDGVWRYEAGTRNPVVQKSRGPHVPVWQTYPAPRTSNIVNYDLFSPPLIRNLVDVATTTRRGVISGVTDDVIFFEDDTSTKGSMNPLSVMLQPVFESFEENSTVVAIVLYVLPWSRVFEGILQDASAPVMLVLHDSCGDSYSYRASGSETSFLGVGDWHNEEFDRYGVSVEVGVTPEYNGTIQTSICSFTLAIYPTEEMEDAYRSSSPMYLTMAVVGVFAFTSLVFLLYDLVVSRQHSTLAATAMKTTTIIANLFPAEVHERLFSSTLAAESSHSAAPKFKMMSMISEEDKQKGQGTGDSKETKKKDAPIADLWPDCTVMFCDIAGFTAWSSVREPSQVFQLLEAVYNEFDAVANRRGVFKVETIGDSYLAVTGLPTPRDDHAIVMVKFAHDCLKLMQTTAHALELELGPGTSELTMRFGIHSGPVTAGVLRGEKTRFQLFGDTVNTASRMESTGERDRIQVSQDTADLLVAAGKEKWLTARETLILAKGKGRLQTFWCNPYRATAFGVSFGDDALMRRPSMATASLASCRLLDGTFVSADGLDERKKRSVHWISESMLKLLKQILARRSVSGWNILMIKKMNDDQVSFSAAGYNGLAVDEVQDVITLPKFDRALARKQADPASVIVPAPAREQLESYISWVALRYRDNPFHSIDHAAHVTLSVSKLLARVSQAEAVDPSNKHNSKSFEALRHDSTYGITSDPLTQFACVFASLIHDADHPGCPNVSLVREQTELAIKYQNRSVAEQNSLDLCWSELMCDKYKDLRSCIYATEEERKRFRQLVVNSVVATDISDTTLSAQRKARWTKAFQGDPVNMEGDGLHGEAESEEVATNRKATIVIEHLIQASDVAHTMQHWHVFIKWNEKLFQEMYKAFVDGRLEKDPSESWYEGELGFYDFYIIPLAKKLKECGVFGVSSAEYLSYATANRQEWEVRGQEVVAGYIAKYARKSGKQLSVRDMKKRKEQECNT